MSEKVTYILCAVLFVLLVGFDGLREDVPGGRGSSSSEHTVR